MSKKIIAITGASASGKTAYAIELALQTNAEIISCDSLLFYKNMDIGTAKPTPLEQKKVPHHLIDICKVTDSFNVKQYEKKALEAINDIFLRGP